MRSATTRQEGPKLQGRRALIWHVCFDIVTSEVKDVNKSGWNSFAGVPVLGEGSLDSSLGQIYLWPRIEGRVQGKAQVPGILSTRWPSPES